MAFDSGAFDSGAFEVPSGSSPQTLTQASRFDNAQTFYTATLSQSGGAQSLTPSLYTNTQTFYAATVTRGAVNLTPALYTNTQTFHAPTVGRGAVTLTPVRYDNGQAFYTATLAIGAATLSPARFDNAQTFYGPVVTTGGALLLPNRVDNAQTFFAPAVSRGTVTLTPPLVSNAQAFYAPNVSNGTPQSITFPNWVDPGWVEPGWVEWPYFNQNQFFVAEVTQSAPQARAGFEMGGRKVYIKRGKRIHIFDTVEDADAWVEAEQQATQAIEKAKGKKKLKAKAKVYKALDEQLPHEVIRLDWLESLVAHFNIPVELPTLEAKQDWMEVARIALLAREMQDEEEVELLLMA